MLSEEAARLPSLHSHWEQSSLEEQLEFISYLFQNALPQCIPKSPIIHDKLIFVRIETNDKMSECTKGQSGQVMPNRSSDEPLLNAGKVSKWEAEEVELIVKLRNEGLVWLISPKLLKKNGREEGPGDRSRSSVRLI